MARQLRNISSATWAPAHVVVVANRVDDASDVARISDALERPVIGVVPNDPLVTEADKLALSPIDHHPGPFVDAVDQLVEVVESNYNSDTQKRTDGTS